MLYVRNAYELGLKAASDRKLLPVLSSSEAR